MHRRPRNKMPVGRWQPIYLPSKWRDPECIQIITPRSKKKGSAKETWEEELEDHCSSPVGPWKAGTSSLDKIPHEQLPQTQL